MRMPVFPFPDRIQADLGEPHAQRMECTGGLQAERAVMLLRTFYVQENQSAPEPKRKSGRAARGPDAPAEQLTSSHSS